MSLRSQRFGWLNQSPASSGDCFVGQNLSSSQRHPSLPKLPLRIAIRGGRSAAAQANGLKTFAKKVKQSACSCSELRVE
jgi:hypothetical protein